MNAKMRAELEGDLESFFRKRVRLVGGKTTKIIPVEAGWPDRLAIFPGGRFFLVELKADDGEVSPIQKQRHLQLADVGVTVHVVYGKTGVVEWIRSVFAAPVGRPRKVVRS